MRLQESIDQLRFYLNEEGERPAGTVNTVRTSDARIAATLVRAILEYLRTNAQASMGDIDPAATTDAILRLREADANGRLLHPDDEIPVHASFLPEIENRAFALLNLRDQQGYRPGLLEVLRALERDSRAS